MGLNTVRSREILVHEALTGTGVDQALSLGEREPRLREKFAEGGIHYPAVTSTLIVKLAREPEDLTVVRSREER